jgi:hypothetical protein
MSKEQALSPVTFVQTIYLMTFWIRIVLIGIFLVSGISKSLLPERILVRTGQTGVEGLPSWQIKAIGLAETLGALGLFLPELIGTATALMSVAAICLGAIMVPAAVVHFRRKEYYVIPVNLALLVACVYLAQALW